MSNYTVYTIGHSTHLIEIFIGFLEKQQINCLIDVRSMPYSKYNPQYNKEFLQEILKQNDILYTHFGKEFGARHTSPSLLDTQGRVDFDKVRASGNFQQGVIRLEDALNQGYRVALMCSEKEPLDCHRFSMISYHLAMEGFNIFHILESGNFISNDALEKEMLKKYHKKIPQSDLFTTVTMEEQLKVAYHLCGQDVAYRPKAFNSEDEEENKI